MHTATLLGKTRHSYKYLIDEKNVELSFFQANDLIEKTGPEGLLEVLDKADYFISNKLCLSELSSKIGVGNLLELISITAQDEFLHFWTESCNDAINNKIFNLKKTFKAFLGVSQLNHYYDLPIVIAMRKIFSEEKQKYKKLVSYKEKGEATSVQGQGLYVDFVEQNGNVSTYFVNGRYLDVCLSGRSSEISPLSMYKTILSLKKGYQNADENAVIAITDIFGFLFIQRVSDSLLYKECMHFFWQIANLRTTSRIRINPNRIVKRVFGSQSERQIYSDVLALLENMMNEQSHILIAGNHSELSSDNESWVLYYQTHSYGGQLRSIKINFLGSINSVHEQKDFLRKKAKTIPDNNRTVSMINDYAYSFRTCTQILTNQLNRHINSILELTIFDVLGIQAVLNQNKRFKYKTQKNMLQYFKRLYEYTASINKLPLNNNPFKCLKFYPQNLTSETHVIPVSHQVLETINRHILDCKEVVRLAFFVGIATGARAASICEMTSDCIIKESSGFKMKLFNSKTAGSLISSGKTPYAFQEIPEVLGNLLLDFIERTKQMRERLEVPYIFIYQKKSIREMSLRLPMVLTDAIFCYEINKLANGAKLFDENGYPDTCSFRKLRAEVGRNMFANGATAEEVARKLVNTAPVAQKHYNNMYPEDEARLYNLHYEATICKSNGIKLCEVHNKGSEEMFGTCVSPKQNCYANDCRNCQQLIPCEP